MVSSHEKAQEENEANEMSILYGCQDGLVAMHKAGLTLSAAMAQLIQVQPSHQTDTLILHSNLILACTTRQTRNQAQKNLNENLLHFPLHPTIVILTTVRLFTGAKKNEAPECSFFQ